MSPKRTTEEFIRLSAEKHLGKTYDYSQTKYVDSTVKVSIICPEHGEFQQLPSHHLTGKGCPKCGFIQRDLKRIQPFDKIVEKANALHNNKYDYSKANYKTTHQHITIICPEHGEFQQTPAHHLQGQACPNCGKIKAQDSRRKTQEDFLYEAQEAHKNGDVQYDYSKTIYKTISEKVIIICPKHGEFLQVPADHLQGSGCWECSVEKRAQMQRSNTHEFIERAKKIHGEKYDYSKVEYINSQTKVHIICPKHGSFEQIPNSHLAGNGCNTCGNETIALGKLSNTAEFIEKAKKVHGINHYDYTLTDYVNNSSKVIITCPKHGDFNQTPQNHLAGSGCGKCKVSVSNKEKRWLKHVAHGKDNFVVHYKVDKYMCDGYDPNTNTVYEFNGCFWHGCAKCFAAEDTNPVTGYTYEEHRSKTVKKQAYLVEKGFQYVEMWECDYNKQVREKLIK